MSWIGDFIRGHLVDHPDRPYEDLETAILIELIGELDALQAAGEITAKVVPYRRGTRVVYSAEPAEGQEVNLHE